MRTQIIVAALASFSALPAFASSQDHAAPGPRTEVVRFDYLDLASTAGQAMLDSQLARAVKRVCASQSGIRDLREWTDERKCRRETKAKAMADRNLAVAGAIQRQRLALASAIRIARP